MYGNKPFYKRKLRPKKVLFFALAIITFTLVLGGVIMLLWNAILPDLLGTRAITFWEAVGLLVLCRLLFGGLRRGFGHRGYSSKRKHWREKWMNMTDEEKAEFKARWKKRCGRNGED